MSVLGIIFLVANIVAFLTFMIDKLLAPSAMRRVPELVLLLMALLFGATGAYLSMRFFRHKTRKPLFYILVPVMMALQLGAVAWWKWGYLLSQ